MCGVYALRPTFGSISSIGHIPGPVSEAGPPEMLTVSPITRSAEDLGLVWALLGARQVSRIGMPAPIAVVQASESAPLSSEVAASIAAAVEHLRACGRPLVDAELPVDLADNWLLCQQLLYAEDAWEASDAVLPEPRPDTPPIEVALWCANMPHRTWRQLKRKRVQTQTLWRQFFTRYAALLLPVMGVAGLPPRAHQVPLVVDEVMIGDRNVPMFALSAWCSLASVAGLPTVSMPIFPTASGLPVGIQVVAGYGGESELLRLVEGFARDLGGSQVAVGRP
jgi:amidase